MFERHDFHDFSDDIYIPYFPIFPHYFPIYFGASILSIPAALKVSSYRRDQEMQVIGEAVLLMLLILR